ncbi:MAG TPA: sigma-54-dependent Fis family transcriptional regulator [Methylophaga aminisulfidivorans]|uniref:Sigma-54-dependent Fis family transcriptional regulator n=2 Tax=root TaxID=1 RepID=A0A7C1W7R7_9GAMM|nr:sigma-54-dependent Fis family transcriptional regulator [Methylophaga aminisulfidivorans]
MLNVLLVEDEMLFAKSVLRRLQREGHRATITETVSDAQMILRESLPDIILLDVRLPDGSGLDFLTELRQNELWHSIPVVMMTAYGELEDAVAAMKLGATDYLKKPVDLDELVLTLAKVMQSQKLNQQLDYSHVRESHLTEQVTMVGNSPSIQSIKEQIQRIVELVDKSKTDYPVILVEGETGTGKDVIARYYHQSGNWRKRPYVHVDCSSLPNDLIEAELFGYEKGAFTNAHQAKPGLIEVAEDGTLFLDEVGELPLELQSKLLSVLERRKVRRLGATQERDVNAHFIAATNRQLNEMVIAGQFRSDLYYRLNVIQINLPPLRERPLDIAPLAAYFVESITRRYGLNQTKFTDDAISAMQKYQWPGNIRELQHVLERAVMLSSNGIIDTHLLLMHQERNMNMSEKQEDVFENLTLEQVEKYLLEKALKNTAGNVSQAARELGLTRMAMRYRMEKYQL